jgi:hypothetical protein
MIYYRLLRDNKETGPYSEEEMIAKGFKPYDLLWAEGKSAGWQYSSEIAAFKKYAPIVEEQPYDRFYKKQTPQKSTATEDRYINRSYTTLPAKANEAAPQQQPVARPTYDYNTQALPGKHIHVTLPSGNTINLTTLVAKKEVRETKETTPANNIPANIESAAINTNIQEPITEKKQPLFTETAIIPQQPVLKEFKTIATSVELNTAKSNENNHAIQQPVYQASNTDFSWTLVLGAVIGIATMVGLGIMIGLSMNREKNDAVFNEALNNKTKQSRVVPAIKPVTTATTVIPAAVTNEEEPAPRQHVPSPVKNKELVQNAVVKTELSPDNTKEEKKSLVTDKSAADKINPVQNQEQAQYTKPSPVVALAIIEKSLSITLNDFKSGAFGGISGLKCTLFNGSKLPLESVEVEVDYIQANNKIFKTEKILFKDISAGAQTTLDAPSSSRGVKIISRIIKVNPREATLTNTTAKS